MTPIIPISATKPRSCARTLSDDDAIIISRTIYPSLAVRQSVRKNQLSCTFFMISLIVVLSAESVSLSFFISSRA